MSNVVERMRRGERIGHDDPDYPQLWQEFEATRALVAELNASYHTPDEQRSLLERIWGQELDESVRMFPPFYTAFGKMTKVGKGVFINFGCTFLDQGGITIGDGVFIAPDVKILSEAHPEEPSRRRTLLTKPVVIGDRVWIGAGATILPGVTIGENAIVAAGAVVSRDVEPDTIVGGVPARVLRKIRRDEDINE